MPMGEFDVVRLLVDLPPNPAGPGFEYPIDGLLAGARGTIVDTYANGEAFEVEFLDEEGYTIALVTLSADQIELVLSQPPDKGVAAVQMSTRQQE